MNKYHLELHLFSFKCITCAISYGKKLAEIKYGSLEDDWFDLKNESQADTEDTEEIPYKYEMVFVKRQSRCFQLKFIY